MRRLCLVLVMSLAAPAIAGAQENATKPETATKSETATRPDLDRAARDAAARAPLAPRPMLDLTPSKILGNGMLTGDRRGDETHPGLSLGNDLDWRAHAAQVGAMAFGFAALTALCSGGSCMLPDGLTDWIPGTGEPIGVSPAVVRPQKPLRQAH